MIEWIEYILKVSITSALFLLLWYFMSKLQMKAWLKVLSKYFTNNILEQLKNKENGQEEK